MIRARQSRRSSSVSPRALNAQPVRSTIRSKSLRNSLKPVPRSVPSRLRAKVGQHVVACHAGNRKGPHLTLPQDVVVLLRRQVDLATQKVDRLLKRDTVSHQCLPVLPDRQVSRPGSSTAPVRHGQIPARRRQAFDQIRVGFGVGKGRTNIADHRRDDRAAETLPFDPTVRSPSSGRRSPAAPDRQRRARSSRCRRPPWRWRPAQRPAVRSTRRHRSRSDNRPRRVVAHLKDLLVALNLVVQVLGLGEVAPDVRDRFAWIVEFDIPAHQRVADRLANKVRVGLGKATRISLWTSPSASERAPRSPELVVSVSPRTASHHQFVQIAGKLLGGRAATFRLQKGNTTFSGDNQAVRSLHGVHCLCQQIMLLACRIAPWYCASVVGAACLRVACSQFASTWRLNQAGQNRTEPRPTQLGRRHHHRSNGGGL